MINRRLAEARGLEEGTIINIELLHLIRAEFLKDAVALLKAPEASQRKVLLEQFIANEQKLQDLWGFERSEAHVMYETLTLKGCNCPRLDNHPREAIYFTSNDTCPWHGRV